MHKILTKEDYIPVSPAEKETVEYKIAHAVKEEIRRHKWNQGTVGNIMDWDAAVEDYMEKHYNDFVQFFMDQMLPKKLKIRRQNRWRTSGFSDVSITKLLHTRL